MNNKINGRTPEEIKKGLECCVADGDIARCEVCPYNNGDLDYGCMDRNAADALILIRQLEARIDILAAKAVLFDEAVAAGEKYKRERDAAVESLHGICWQCVHFERGKLLLEKEVCMNCTHNFNEETLPDNWQWRGVQEVE